MRDATESQVRGSLPATVVCSIRADETAAALRAIGEAPPACDLIELRADRLPLSEIAPLVRRAQRPLIVTIRPLHADGRFEGSESERRGGLDAALEAGARFVDVEYGTPVAELADGPHAERVILSHHGASGGTDELRALYREMARSAAARLKIVPQLPVAEGLAAVRALLDLAAAEHRPLACFSSGREGLASRLVACAWGSWGVYGSARAGTETAAGQPTAADLLEVHDVLGSGPRTAWFALVGSDLSRSPSAAMHNAAYRSLELDARYLPLEMAKLAPLKALVDPDGPIGLRGFGVTIPHKETVARSCRLADEVARRSRAVNTVRLESARWDGFNTDGPGALSVIESRLEPRGRRVAIAGAGGTARAIAASLAAAGARVCLFNRDAARAGRVGRELGLQAGRLEELAGATWDILVNATPLGADGGRLVPAESLRGRLVVDAVYRAGETALSRDARQRGLAVIDGFDLLLAQGERQLRIMTGRAAPRGVMEQAGRRHLAPPAC